MTQKVLIVDFTSSFGGAFEHALALAQYLAEKPDVSVGLVSAQSEPMVRSRVSRGVATFSIPPYQKLTVGWPVGRVGRACSAVKDIVLGELPRVIQLNRICRQFSPTVVHLNNLINIQQSGVFVARMRGVPCVFCHQDFEFRSRLALWAMAYVDKHVAISQAMKQHLLELGVLKEKIEVIHHGVDISRFSPNVGRVDLNERYAIPRHKLIFSLFGRLVDWKGPEIFLRAAATVVKQNPNAHALIVGDASDGDPLYVEKLKQLVRDLSITENVTFAGYTSDTARYMNAVDLVVHTSTRPEPFGLVVTEAMACQKPVIAMAEGGPLDIVVDGETGRLVKPRDPEALAAAIVDALSSEEKLRSWGEASRKRVISHFSLERCGRHYAELYSALAS